MAEERIKKMEALVSLIDEPHPDVFKDISSNIMQFGTDIIPFLENAWETGQSPEVQSRIENIIDRIQFNQVCIELKEWMLGDKEDLLAGCFIIARYQYPELDEDKIKYDFFKLQKDIWLEINDNLTALEQIKVFNHMFYNIHGFEGNMEDYHDPKNSFINDVIQTKRGNPLTMSVVYMILAQSLNMPVKGVNLPEHFMLAYTGSKLDPESLTIEKENVLFYINAFTKGAVYSFKDIENFLKQLNMETHPKYYNPCSNADIIQRMLNNLFVSYMKESRKDKSEDIRLLISIINDNKEQDANF